MKTPHIKISNETIIPHISKKSYLPRIQSTIKNKTYKNNNFEIISHHKPVKQNLLLQIPLAYYFSDNSSSRRSTESVNGNLLSTPVYTIEMTSDVLKFSPDSSIDTNEGNK